MQKFREIAQLWLEYLIFFIRNENSRNQNLKSGTITLIKHFLFRTLLYEIGKCENG